MFGRRIPFNQIAVATLVGVGGRCVCIQAYIEPPRKPPSAPDQDLKTDPEEQRAETNTTSTANASAPKTDVKLDSVRV